VPDGDMPLEGMESFSQWKNSPLSNGTCKKSVVVVVALRFLGFAIVNGVILGAAEAGAVAAAAFMATGAGVTAITATECCIFKCFYLGCIFLNFGKKIKEKK